MPERVHELEFDEFDKLLGEIPRATVTPNTEEFGVFGSSKNPKNLYATPENGTFLDTFSDEKLSVRRVQFIEGNLLNDQSLESVFQDLSIKDRPILLSPTPSLVSSSTPFNGVDFNGQELVAIPMIPNQQQLFFDAQSYFHPSQPKSESHITWRNLENERHYHPMQMHQFCKSSHLESQPRPVQQAAPSLTQFMSHGMHGSNQKVPEKILTRSHGMNSLGSLKFGSFERKDPVSSGVNVKQQPLQKSADDFGERVYIMAKDQQGCRLLQKKFAEGTREDLENIFRDVILHVVELMTDPFGNYLVQKLLEVCDKHQHMQILRVITRKPGDLVRISCDMHGYAFVALVNKYLKTTRAVQKVVETLKTREQCSMVVSALKPGIIVLMKNMNGNHVAQRFLQYLKPEFNEKCLSHSDGEPRRRLVREITSNALILSQDPYGNYVVQYVFELQVPWATAAILDQLEGNCGDLAMQKYSSNVVEKCLKYAREERRICIINELMNNPRTGRGNKTPRSRATHEPVRQKGFVE
ncbi:Armadillo-like helical [Cynara cardunculus var. scolymus]|uniref:Armadillo-like helical n=1 Tax=Cynara cardunculus var. scolymus TaxID=59895 RepID=A0A103Y0I2_CYNCS|nr:Armadillo-like helical [Cynara cardunculus var. scolymus]